MATELRMMMVMVMLRDDASGVNRVKKTKNDSKTERVEIHFRIKDPQHLMSYTTEHRTDKTEAMLNRK